MQTSLADSVRDTRAGREADAILRSCVHCGFCNATCPTYQLLGDELDGPRGRIYLIKQALEGHAPTRATLTHLDRCLTCRACETTCPSGVRYGALLDIGRSLVERQVTRPWQERISRALLRALVPYRARFTLLLRLGQFLRPLLPGPLRRSIPARQKATAWPAMRMDAQVPRETGSRERPPRHARSLPASCLPGHSHIPVRRRMLVLDGCAQGAISPNINAAAARVLDRLGIALVRAPGAGCCGALHHHTSDPGHALDFARRNLDAWWPQLEAGCEVVVMTASGCGVHVKEYGHLLRDDAAYAAKAQRVSALTRDVCEILAREDLAPLKQDIRPGTRLAFQSPCTLQHGQQLNGVTEKILSDLGFVLAPVPGGHLCCGAAGSYSLLQPGLSKQLRQNKLAALESGRPDMIATANIGCLTHLQTSASVPVRHWIELLAP
jgi:glycolate oxidase iron-sulfur subunit